MQISTDRGLPTSEQTKQGNQHGCICAASTKPSPTKHSNPANCYRKLATTSCKPTCNQREPRQEPSQSLWKSGKPSGSKSKPIAVEIRDLQLLKPEDPKQGPSQSRWKSENFWNPVDSKQDPSQLVCKSGNRTCWNLAGSKQDPSQSRWKSGFITFTAYLEPSGSNAGSKPIAMEIWSKQGATLPLIMILFRNQDTWIQAGTQMANLKILTRGRGI